MCGWEGLTKQPGWSQQGGHTQGDDTDRGYQHVLPLTTAAASSSRLLLEDLCLFSSSSADVVVIRAPFTVLPSDNLLVSISDDEAMSGALLWDSWWNNSSIKISKPVPEVKNKWGTKLHQSGSEPFFSFVAHVCVSVHYSADVLPSPQLCGGCWWFTFTLFLFIITCRWYFAWWKMNMCSN